MIEFTKKELEQISFLINFYIMNNSYKDVSRDIKLLENKVKGELNGSNN